MKEKIAKQIADLLNSENQLVVKYSQDIVLKNANQYLYLTTENNELKACIECKIVQWYQYEVCHLTVHPEHRRKGLGTEILRIAEMYAKENNGRVIQCTIREGNEGSAKLFSNSGFLKTSVFYYPTSGNNVGVWQKVICKKINTL